LLRRYGFAIYDLGIVIPNPVRLWCDNIIATYMSANPIHHDRSKHIAIDNHFVRKWVAARDSVVRYIPTSSQIADIFTK